MSALHSAQRLMVRRLYARGVSLRAIARIAGVSLSSVIRHTHARTRRPIIARSEEDPPPGYRPNRLARCPGCGGLVYVWPCLLCTIREQGRGRGEGEKRQRDRGAEGKRAPRPINVEP